MRERLGFDYSDAYDEVNAHSSLAGKMLLKSHRLLEKSLPELPQNQLVLEVGAGTGHHYPCVNKQDIARYVLSDCNDNMLRRLSEKFSADIQAGALSVEKADARRLDNFASASFDRLIATHVLEHLPDPIGTLEEWCRVLKPNGILSLVLPCDPGLLWRTGRHLGPRRAATRAGNPAYDYMMATEHINAIFNLYHIIHYHFSDIRESWWPCRVALPDINLFYICHIRNT